MPELLDISLELMVKENENELSHGSSSIHFTSRRSVPIYGVCRNIFTSAAAQNCPQKRIVVKQYMTIKASVGVIPATFAQRTRKIVRNNIRYLVNTIHP